MNRALLAELQGQRCYPSVTLLLNTTPGSPLTPAETDAAMRLIAQMDDRLEGDVSDALRRHLRERIVDLLHAESGQPASHALALFVSPDHTAAVRLGRAVDERVTIDDTFTTRDLVADLNRTALYRVVAVSERTTRVLVGDRQRLVEQRDDRWPLVRTDEHTATTWARDVARLLDAEHAEHPLPTVVAGVQRSVRRLTRQHAQAIGVIPGNHDRTTATELHSIAWPLVADWLRTDAARALDRLDDARSVNRYAGGIHEIWPLVHDGRVDTLVVEAGFRLPARVDAHNQIHPADDPDHPEVYDDIVDDTIETVLQLGGTAVIVNDGTLDHTERIAAVLRF
jgi:hypothetical protein